MQARMKTIEVEEQFTELTRDQLMSLRSAMRGGNAESDNHQLLIYAAGLLSGHDSLASALRERAAILSAGLKEIENIIWPE
jgi:hypothetical protein